MDTDTPSSPYRVSLALVDGFALMSFSSLVEPLRAANLLAGKTLFRVQCFSLTDEFAVSSSGAMIPASRLPGIGERSELAMVVAGGDPFAVEDPQLFAWLRAQVRRGVRVGGVSGGPVILVKAGLMEDRRMTVHWEHAHALKELNPELLLEPSLYVIDRDRITCAGGTAPMDFAHMLIADRCGSELAQLVSDWFMHTEVRRSEGPQRSGLMDRYGTRSRPVLRAIEAMEAHVADPISLQQLARRAGVSARQLSRLFRRDLGQSPMATYRSLRLEIAQRLLESSTLSVTEIALATGFSDSANFSKNWKRRWGSAPSAMRPGGRRPKRVFAVPDELPFST